MLTTIFGLIVTAFIGLGIGIFFLVFGILMTWLVGMMLLMCGYAVFGILGLDWLYEDIVDYFGGKWDRFHDNIRERITRGKRLREEREREHKRHIQLAEKALREDENATTQQPESTT